MTREVECTLVGDGSSDRMLLHPIRWCLDQLYPEQLINVQYAELRGLTRNNGLAERIKRALELYHPTDVLFVHRDAENVSPDRRRAEIESAVRSIPGLAPQVVVPVIPVRMSEAWILHDEAAIRYAANNPNGQMPLSLPPTRKLPDVADPKETLKQLLCTASGRNRRRMRSFNESAAVHRVAELIEDYSALRQLEAFSQLEEDLEALRLTIFL